jgi:hypothetical protein
MLRIFKNYKKSERKDGQGRQMTICLPHQIHTASVAENISVLSLFLMEKYAKDH